MILYFSATGNSAWAARRIAGALGDEVRDLFGPIREGDVSPMASARPWVIVTPTYAWRMPRLVEAWLRRAPLTGSREVYIVMTCGEDVGDAARYAAGLFAQKGMICRGCLGAVMPENYIALFATPARAEAMDIIRRAEGAVDEGIRRIRAGEDFPAPRAGVADRLKSGPVNRLFYPLFVHARKFTATSACVSCGLCQRVCPLGNIRLEGGRPRWGKRCTHCMACINRCPKEAIEYGRHSRGLPRYVCPDKEPDSP